MKKLAVVAMVAVLGFSGTAFADGAYVSGNLGLGVQPSATNTRDNAPVAGVAAGYDFGKVRLEAEYLKASQSNTGGGSIGGIDVDLFSVNAAVEPFTFRGFTPFATAGVGYALLGGSGVVNHNGRVDRQSTPVLNVGAGLSYAINTNWALVGEYRYLVSTRDAVVQNDGTRNNWASNLFTVGARYAF